MNYRCQQLCIFCFQRCTRNHGSAENKIRNQNRLVDRLHERNYGHAQGQRNNFTNSFDIDVMVDLIYWDFLFGYIYF